MWRIINSVWKIIPLLGIVSINIAQNHGMDPWYFGFAFVLITVAFWLLSPLFDWVWYKHKLPKTFSGTNTWRGEWASAKNKGAHGRLNAVVPEEYKNTVGFSADALLYNSIRSQNNPGTFRSVSIAATMKKNLAGNAMVASSPKVDAFEVNYNALVSEDSKQIAGGYEDHRDFGTFWIRKEAY